LFLFSCCR